MKTERVIAIVREQLLFLIGAGGIIYQLVTGRVNFWLLIVFTAMVGLIGTTTLISILRGLPTNAQLPQRVLPPSQSDSENAS